MDSSSLSVEHPPANLSEKLNETGEFEIQVKKVEVTDEGTKVVDITDQIIPENDTSNVLRVDLKTDDDNIVTDELNNSDVKIPDSVISDATVEKVDRIESTSETSSSSHVKKRILPAWMLAGSNAVPDAVAEPTGRTRSVTKVQQTSRKSKTKPSSDEESMVEDEDEEEYCGKRGRQQVEPRRQKRAAAVKVCSYAEREYVVNDSEFSDSSNSSSTVNGHTSYRRGPLSRSTGRRKKNDSDEEYEDDEYVQQDDESGSEYNNNSKDGSYSPSSRRRSSKSKKGRQRSSSGKRRPSVSAGRRSHNPRKRSRRTSDDEFIDDEDSLEYKPRSSKSRGSTSTTENKTDDQGRPACVYGEKCYRKNVLHKKEYSHPGDDDWVAEQKEEAADQDIIVKKSPAKKARLIEDDDDDESTPEKDSGPPTKRYSTRQR